MHKAYATRELAVADLVKNHFAWNATTERWERGEKYISLIVGYLGQCADGRWIVTRA